jgi:DNA modification methylase
MPNWKNRIVGYDVVDPNQLLANPFNHRIHTRLQQEHLESILDEIGWIDDVIVNQTTAHIIDGHLRVTLAQRNDEQIPVKIVELTEAEEKLALASFDYITGEAVVDPEIMALILEEVKDEYPDIMLLKDMDTELETGVFDEEMPDDPGPEIDKAEELREKWGVESGQLWQLGEHKIICGDCTDKEVVARLMGGEKAGLVWTDPPYGINYQDLAGIHEEIVNDDVFPLVLIGDALLLTPDCPAYICCNWKSISDFIGVMEDSGFEPKACIVWDKETRIQNLDKYYKQHEFILYAGAFGGQATLDGDVWRVGRKTRKDHPTAKPVELVERAVLHERAESVYDPFLGSGTTLIACERLNRTCYGIEIEPKYIAVTLERWHQMTGETPVLIDG